MNQHQQPVRAGRSPERRATSLFALFRCLTLGFVLAGGVGEGTLLRAEEASTGASEKQNFTQMSLDELAKIEVTTVSKKSEKLSEAPAAVTVITRNEIRRSGAETLPEALRLVPGTEVARVNSAQWAVSVRGFNDTFAQKLLVLIDGRSVYTPLFSGTFWEAQDVMLEDLDRIEVIRGPGGTVWGANAVNGVINIVMKPARETQGLLLSGGAGSDHLGAASVRYGGQLGEKTFFRIYGKYDDWDNFHLADGSGEANDAWWKAQGGFRLDWEPADENQLTLQGDLVGLTKHQNAPQVSVLPPYNSEHPTQTDVDNGNVLGRWTHRFAEDSDLAVQAYYDRSQVDAPLEGEDRSTYDLDARHRFQLSGAQELVWGGGYRASISELRGSPEVSFARPTRTDQIFNLFAQDEIALVPERLRLTVGTKIEHNNYTGWETEPGIRLAWTPDDRQTFWASVARAVRTPSEIENDGRVNLGAVPPGPGRPFPTLVTLVGSTGFQAEKLTAVELGYRVQPHHRLALDAAVFVNFYDDLRSSDGHLDASQLPAYLQSISVLNNGGDGTTFGAELSATWQAAEWWRLKALFTFLDSDLHQPVNSLTGQPSSDGFASPRYQASLRSGMDLARNVEFDVWVRYVDEVAGPGSAIPGLAASDRQIPSYVTFDLRLTWRPLENVELSLVGQNLAGSHREFIPTFFSTQQTEVSPSIFGKLTVRF